MKLSIKSPADVVSIIFRLIGLVYVGALVYTAYFIIAFYATLAIGDNFEKALAVDGGQFNDFRTYLSLGKLANSDKRSELYDWKVQDAWLRQDMKALPTNNKTNYINYAPYFFLIMIPLSMLPPQLVLGGWYLISLAVAGTALVLLCRESGHLNSRVQKSLFLLGAFVNMPSTQGLALGQLCWFQCGIVGLYFLCYLQGRDVLGGLSLVLLAIKPHHALFVSLPAFAGRRWKLLLTAAVTVALLCAAAGVQLGWNNVIGYPQVLLSRAANQEMEAIFHTAIRSISVRAIFSVFLPWNLTLAASSVVMLASLLFLLYSWRQAALASAKTKRWAFALTVVLLLLTGPHSHIYDAVFLSVPAALTLPTLDLHKIAVLRPISLRYWSFLCLAFPIISLSYIMYYKVMYPDFVLFIVIEALMALTGYLCFRQSLKDDQLAG